MFKQLLFLFTLCFSTSLMAQTSIDVLEEADKTIKKRHVLPTVPKHQFTYDVYYDRLVVEYEERMKENIKKYRAMAREMEKPQYSDFSYFGHKRKPKKRPVGKRKFCQECEIVH